jgi:hypothetical protein
VNEFVETLKEGDERFQQYGDAHFEQMPVTFDRQAKLFFYQSLPARTKLSRMFPTL